MNSIRRATISRAVGSLALLIAMTTSGVTFGRSKPVECNDKCLRQKLDGYMQALLKHEPSRIAAKGLRFTENGQEMKLGKGLWEKASGLTPYAHYLTDRLSQQAMFIGVVKEGDEKTITSIRLGIKDGKITEVEHIVARKGSHALFAPEALTQPNALLTSEVPRVNRLPRKRLVTIANSYLEGIQQHSSKMVIAANDCQRIENGVQTTNQPGRGSRNCQESADLLTYIKSVDERRFPIVDVESGIVVSTFIFNIPGEESNANDANISSNAQVAARLRQPRTLLLTEWFKIDHGVIEHIEAVMHNLPYGSKSGW